MNNLKSQDFDGGGYTLTLFFVFKLFLCVLSIPQNLSPIGVVVPEIVDIRARARTDFPAKKNFFFRLSSPNQGGRIPRSAGAPLPGSELISHEVRPNPIPNI